MEPAPFFLWPFLWPDQRVSYSLEVDCWMNVIAGLATPPPQALRFIVHENPSSLQILEPPRTLSHFRPHHFMSRLGEISPGKSSLRSGACSHQALLGFAQAIRRPSPNGEKGAGHFGFNHNGDSGQKN